MNTRAANVSPVARALLGGVVDYAGLFPPAALSMSHAVAEFAVQRGSASSWMLGRFVVPVARLQELAMARARLADAAEGAWPLSVLVSADPAGDAESIRDFTATGDGRLIVESVELRAASAEAIDWALPQIDGVLERYVEIPVANPRSMLEAIKRHGGRAKVRTGGVTSDAFPSAEGLARFILACAELAVPFKATAGLHHPLRGEQPLTYERDAAAATMFGFLGVFAAAAFARRGAELATLVGLLEEQDPDAFVFTDDAIRWHQYSLDVDEIRAARHEFAISFGSCSFREPVADLNRLGVL